MQLYILYFLTFGAMLWAFTTILLKITHMYQLSSYQKPSYMRYLHENAPYYFDARKMLMLILALGAMLMNSVQLAIAALILGALYAIFHPKREAKKPLAYTARIKRLLGCAFGFFIVLTIICGYFGGVPFAIAAQAFMIFACPRLILAFSFIISPVEKRISDWYINDARKKLAGAKNLKIIGITGSFGKTSTKYFVSELLGIKYNVYMTPGNFNTTLGVTRAIREGLLPTHDVFVCEMGARHVGDIKEICDLVHPNIGIITSIGEQHLETFGSIENVISTKMELYDSVREAGVSVLNYDNEHIRKHGCQGEVISYGTGGDEACVASNIEVNQSGGEFTVTTGGKTRRFKTKLLGRANIENLLAAIAVCVHMGIALDRLVPAVARLKSVPHRLELKSGGAYTMIDDAYNANPQGAKIALETLKMCVGTRILMTPGIVELGDRESECNFELGETAAKCCDYAILIGAVRTKPIYDGLLGGGFDADKIFVCDKVSAGFERILALPGGAERMALVLNDLPDNY